ncbi:hypothetical protein VINE108274_02075 [Vibrio neptunius]
MITATKAKIGMLTPTRYYYTKIYVRKVASVFGLEVLRQEFRDVRKGYSIPSLKNSISNTGS